MKTKLLLILAFLMLPLGIWATEVEIDGINYDLDEESKTATVISSPQCTGNVVIPAKVSDNEEDYDVTAIDESAFFYCTDLTGITIPSSVTSIGIYAFCGCFSLQSITIPGSVKTIGACAFANCYELSSVTLGSGVESIEDYAFTFAGLKSITIPASVTAIGTAPFSGCNLETIVVDAKNEVFDSRDNCNAIIETATNTLIQGCMTTTIPASVTEIGTESFSYYNMESITIPASVTSIGSSPFAGCSSLRTIVVDEKNKTFDSRDNCNAIIETASNTLVQGCQNTTIPNTVTSIGSFAFYYCYGLKAIDIPSSVTEIGSAAFYSCGDLESITIPSSVTELSNDVFESCVNLKSVNLPNTLTTIGNYAFDNCLDLESINIPKSVKKIGEWAFNNCLSLPSINLPNSLTELAGHAFYNCSSLTSITIPAAVTSIGESAFASCTSLTSINALRTSPADYNAAMDCFDEIDASACTLHVVSGCADAYKALAPWNKFDTVSDDIPTGIETPSMVNGQCSMTFDLLGRRTMQPARGIYVKDGKKLIR